MKAVKIILILLVVGIFLIYFIPSDLLDNKEIENEIEEVAEVIEEDESEDVKIVEAQEPKAEKEQQVEKAQVQKSAKQKDVSPQPEELIEVENIDAQNHLAFKGIPIAGSMELFTKRLKEKGFSRIDKNGSTYFFEGDFTGRPATVAVASTENGNVYSVTVFFTPSKEWNKLVETYSYYKKLYIRKYGTLVASKEIIKPIIDSNIAKMSEVNEGKVTWKSSWKDKGGDIELSIEKTDGIYEGVVVIYYKDSQNVEAKIKNDLEEI